MKKRAKNLLVSGVVLLSVGAAEDPTAFVSGAKV